MTLAETYNRIAEAWHRDHSNDDWWKEGTDTLLSMLPQQATVLDVGCGSGVKAKYFLDRGLIVTGIDISENLLTIARREAPAGTYQLLAMENLDSMQEQFDAVFAQASLLHIPKGNAEDVVGKMAARAKPNGFVYIAVKESRPGKPDEEIKKENDYGYDYERPFTYFQMAELEAYMGKAGLSVVWKEGKPSGKTVWLQIIAKRC
ncbi:MAG TPA: class I SAM-dependent methyltransferase [Candidatus Paceibacterota bacterium]|nr:class I SAM-dependent methyltransferase [Candidatus Paceibacterota bacterium]